MDEFMHTMTEEYNTLVNPQPVKVSVEQRVDQCLNLEDISYSTCMVTKNFSKEFNNISTPYSLPHTKFGSYKPMEWTIELFKMEEHCDDEKDESNVCRLCLGTTNVTVHIGHHSVKSTSIVEKIHYCTSLVVKVGDNFPQNICTTCADNLELTYNFKSKAISCDLELSKNVHRDVHFTYTQVSDDPLNMTYTLDLEDHDTSKDLVDSCVYNIVDGDELQIEQVNITTDEPKNLLTMLKKPINDNESTISVIINNESQTSKIIINKSNDDLNNSYDTSANNKMKNVAVDVKRNQIKASLDDEKIKSKKKKTDNNADNDKPLLIVKNGKVVYICNICDYEADSMAFLLSHRTRMHFDMGSFKCTECPTYHKTAGLLKRHISLYHDVTHVCKYCDKRFSNKQGLDRHVNCTHNITPLEFQCVKCNAYFDTIDKMENHLVVHYTNPSSTFSCNHCDRTFSTYAAKNKHTDLEHMVEIECDICHVVLPNKEAMDKHTNSVHQPKKKGNQMYACTTCGKYFSSIKDILIHRETHASK